MIGAGFEITYSRPKESVKLKLLDPERVTAFEITEADDKMETMVLGIDNYDLSQYDVEAWAKGNQLSAVFWNGDGVVSTRPYTTKVVVGFPDLKLTAFGQTLALAAKEKTRAFKNMTHSDVVAQVAAEYGFVDQRRIQIQATKAKYGQIQQSHESDAHLLQRLAESNGFQFFISGTVFHWHEKNRKQSPIHTFHYYESPQGEVISFKVDDDTASKPGSIEAAGFNPLTKEFYTASASNEDTKLTALGNRFITYSKESGEHQIVTEAKMPTPKATKQQAKEHVDGAFKAMIDENLEGVLVTHLMPNIPAKSIIRIEGVGKVYSGNYYVKEVKHKIEAEEGRSEFRVQRNAASAALVAGGDGEVKGDTNNSPATKDPKALVGIINVSKETGKSVVSFEPAGASR